MPTPNIERKYTRGPYRRVCGHVHDAYVYPENCRLIMRHRKGARKRVHADQVTANLATTPATYGAEDII
jgi:hypothetical protein